MIPVAKLKQNLDFNKNLGNVVEVMKLAAMLQFNQFRLTNEPFLEFCSSLEKALGFIPKSKKDNIFLRPLSAQAPAVFILVSSDEGFLGELNGILVNRLVDKKRKGDKIFVLGRQGEEYLSELMVDFTLLPSMSDKLEFSQIASLRDSFFQLYFTGEVSGIYIIYARFVNITTQQVETETLLPIMEPLYSGAIENRPLTANIGEVLFEPDFERVIGAWAKLWLFFKLYQILWLSKLAEFSARIMHLEGSIQELTRVNQSLNLEYFKYLHGLSDKTIREIYAARLIKPGG